MELDPNLIYEKFRLSGEKWSLAEEEASRLEHKRKILRAQIMTTFGDLSINRAEMLAEADPAYEEHIEKMVVARRIANVAWAEYEAIRVWVEVVRSKEATERAQANLR